MDITLHQKEDALYIEFDVPEKAITPGQFAAWYMEDELVGSGTMPIKMTYVRVAIAYLLFLSTAQAQETHSYSIFLTAKENVQLLDHPQEFLSERALRRREDQNIAVKRSDLPIS